MNIEKLIRPHIRDLKPYSSARDEYHGGAEIYLDANENPFEQPARVNRYPDPVQTALKNELAKRKGVDCEEIFVGNGSDEALDVLVRTIIEPNKDEILICPPTYGMYTVLAEIHQSKILRVPLTTEFELDTEAVLRAITPNTKIIFLCSPNNPTGNLLPTESIERLLTNANSLVVIDEAYIDFASFSGWIERIREFPNLMVLQTFSKAWGLAGLRVGMLYGNRTIISAMNKVKYPYNVNTISQHQALRALTEDDEVRGNVNSILSERERLTKALKSLPSVVNVYPSESNFLLVQVSDASKIYKELCSKGIIVRDRSKELHCMQCLRITIGTPEENTKLLSELEKL